LGIGECGALTVISFGLVVTSGNGPQAICASLLFDTADLLADVYWVACVDDGKVHVLPQDGSVTQAILSSDPFCFGDLYVHNSQLPETSGIHRMTSFSPFQLRVPLHFTCTQKLSRLLQLCEACSAATEFSSFVKREYLDLFSAFMNTNLPPAVCAVKEEVQQLTTPKGIWTCATGNGQKTEVNLSDRWLHRSNKLLVQIDKYARRGVLLEVVTLGWFPSGAIRCVS
jgi:hypothetical protein